MQALQRLLTSSHSGKMLAVKRVTENRGKRRWTARYGHPRRPGETAHWWCRTR
nr:reverse transcriptase N-terminal domain-containing protein [Mesorhizobium japonicum]